MNGSLLPAVLWSALALLGLVYGGLFLFARRPVAIRIIRIGIASALFAALRLVLLAAGFPLILEWEIAAGGTALVVAVACLLGRRAWLIRASLEEFRGFMVAGCDGLFIDMRESDPGSFVLSAKKSTWQVRLVRITGKVQFAVVRPPSEPGKLALFVQWLSKQYPGPVPRIRIILQRSEP